MNEDQFCRVLLSPTNVEIHARRGSSLRDLLFEHGVEFPCGGQHRCRGCRIRVVDGNVDATDIQRERLTEAEIAGGWRLACQCQVDSDLTIELRQWDASILSNDSGFVFTPQEGLGVAVDLGTTTVVAQLLDLATGRVLGVRTGLNGQARYGGDIMSRIQHALTPGGQDQLTGIIRTEIGKMLGQLLEIAGKANEKVCKVVLVGNTAMHHLFSGIDISPLASYPFEPVRDGMIEFGTADLNWPLTGDAVVRFLPCLGGFVGSDILAGILATGISESERLTCFLDLGTNSEIVIGDRHRMLCASGAAGPAFEGARIGMGMRASTGAIWRVQVHEHEMVCDVLGNVAACGICGSGLIDAVAVGLSLGKVAPSGRLGDSAGLHLTDSVLISQNDIRQLQLAKGAIAAGIRLLLKQYGAKVTEIEKVYLAGAFGNYINRASARSIGLLPFSEERVEASGNTALLGAKIALCSTELNYDYSNLRSRMQHVPLNADPEFQDVYVDEMPFPVA